jgi:membrane protein DedA with SNARE-associated domain
MSGVRPAPFLVLNFISAAIWATAISVLGYDFGHAVKAALGHLHDHIYIAIALALGGGVVVWLYHVWLRRRRAKRAARLETATRRP